MTLTSYNRRIIYAVRHIFLMSAFVCLAPSGFAQITGRWQVPVTIPEGEDQAQFDTKESEGNVEGFYSGILGQKKPVTGTFKENKASLSFSGEWPTDGSSTDVKVTGEYSGDSGSGILVVRWAGQTSEGTWTARRLLEQQENSHPESAGPPPANSASREQWDKYSGDWHVDTGAQAVEDAIRQATESMGMFARGVARGRLMKANAPPALIGVERQDEFLLITFGDAPTQKLPLSGAEVHQGDLTAHVQFEDSALRHVGETHEGRRENVFRVGQSRDSMSIDVTVTSPRMPVPLKYRLELSRTEPITKKDSETVGSPRRLP